uniref:Protein FAM228B n=1 Tax=Anser cygnoides TaxID=8845 RepID=A0A8B9EJV5_ANSCY
DLRCRQIHEQGRNKTVSCFGSVFLVIFPLPPVFLCGERCPLLPSRGTPEPGARSQWQCSHAKERVVCSHGTPALPLFQNIAAATLNPTPQSKAHWPCFCCLPWCNRPFVAAQVIILNSKVVLTPAFTSCVLLVFCQAAPDESRGIITSAQAILDRENYFVREVDRYLRHNDFLNLRKKEILYKKWLEVVSEPLLQKIEDKMDSQSSDEIEKRKEEQLSLYLNYCKKKVSIPALQDPLLKAVQRKFVETGIVKQCETGRLCSAREVNELSKAELPLLPLSRQRMDAVAWLKIPSAYIASEAHRTKRQRVVEHHKDSTS